MKNYLLNWKRTIQAGLTLTLIGWTAPVLSSPAHILIDFQDDVQVKKAQWNKFHQAESGMTLSGKDKIKVGSNAEVTVYCGDRTKWTVQQPGTYLVSQGCPTGETVVALCPDCNNMTTRSIGQKEYDLKKLPYLISPRHTYVFNDSFTIRWHEVPGATKYKVKVEDWIKETKETHISYDGELESGEYYRITVLADNGVTSKDEDSGLDGWFTVLEDEKAKTLREEVADIKKQGLSPEQKGLLLAHFYRGHKLYFEAILEDINYILRLFWYWKG